MNYVLTGKKIPAELTNVDANTKTTDVGSVIPTTTIQKIYEKMEAIGMILPHIVLLSRHILHHRLQSCVTSKYSFCGQIILSLQSDAI